MTGWGKRWIETVPTGIPVYGREVMVAEKKVDKSDDGGKGSG